MSHLDRLLHDARHGLSPWQRLPADRVAHIGRQFGRSEIAAALERLDLLAYERDQLSAWDGDTADDIWEAQYALQRLLEQAPSEYAPLIAAGLNSPRANTRMIVALALARHDGETVGPLLRAALDTDPDEGVRFIITAALVRLETGAQPGTSG